MKDLVKNILKGQSLMRVTLNGGSRVLDDATIPFQIGFEKSVAEKQPSHIMVLDVTNYAFTEKTKEDYEDEEDVDDSGRNLYDNIAERTIFKLQPIHYLQFKKPGIHHLIFILFSKVDKKYYQNLLEKQYSSYENELRFEKIEENRLKNQLCYAEVVVDVPKLFFADSPETKFQKAIWKWTNSWYRLKPVDQCEYRERKIWAFTLKPILWLIGFIPRIISAVFWSIFSILVRVLCIFFGIQPVSFFPNTKKLWVDFLFLYPKEGYKNTFSLNCWFGDSLKRGSHGDPTDFYYFKELVIGEKRIHIPMTLSGITFYPTMLFLYGYGIYEYFAKDDWVKYPVLILCFQILVALLIAILIPISTLPSLKKSKEWRDIWTKKAGKNKVIVGNLLFFTLTIIALVFFLVIYVSWISVWAFLMKFIILLICATIASVIIAFVVVFFKNIFNAKFKKAMQGFFKKLGRMFSFNTETKKVTKKEKHEQWLVTSFNINTLPKKVDLKTMPAPSTVVHRFRVKFWQTKALMCKPYAK